MGAVCWYPKGNVALTTGAYDPIAQLKEIFTGLTINFKLKAGGSRYYCEDAALTLTTAKVTFAGTAKDDAGVDHIVGECYVCGTKGYETVGEFLDAYLADDAESGVLSSKEASFSETQSSGTYVTVLAIADDGTISLVSKAI